MATKHSLHAAEGFTLHKTGPKTVELRNNGGLGATTSFTCGCDKSGGCRVDLEGTSASCENDGCSGSCTWSIHIPGLQGTHYIARVQDK